METAVGEDDVAKIHLEPLPLTVLFNQLIVAVSQTQQVPSKVRHPLLELCINGNGKKEYPVRKEKEDSVRFTSSPFSNLTFDEYFRP
jgi:hypothetical protein